MGFYRDRRFVPSTNLTLDDREVMLAQEQDVVMRPGGMAKEIEGEFGLAGEREGTLVLTNRRLIFVTTNEKEESLVEPNLLDPWGRVALSYSDVEDLSTIPEDPKNVFVPLASISKTVGHKGLISPRLEVTWAAGGRSVSAVFTEELTGRRKKNLNDWVGVIERLRLGTQAIEDLPKGPAADTLEGRVMGVFADMQEKGVMTVAGELREAFHQDFDIDEVQGACDSLASQGLLVLQKDESGVGFYRKRSPLGPDDLSV